MGQTSAPANSRAAAGEARVAEGGGPSRGCGARRLRARTGLPAAEGPYISPTLPVCDVRPEAEARRPKLAHNIL